MTLKINNLKTMKKEILKQAAKETMTDPFVIVLFIFMIIGIILVLI
jgi:hypothetical protein